MHSENDRSSLWFLQELLQSIFNFQTTYQDIYNGETAFNTLFVYPFLKAVGRSVSNELAFTKCDFSEGEVNLQSMTKQLKSLGMNLDDRNTYKADGIIRLYGCKNLEILVLETSHHFGCTDEPKSRFDHHKGLFGSLSMLKTKADQYRYGSIAKFSKIKVFFIHAANRTVYLWSMSLADEESIYDLWLEDFLDIKGTIDDKLQDIPNFLQFYWKLKELLKETSQAILELKKEHEANLTRDMFNPTNSLKPLSNIVNPSILRLIEEEDKTSTAKLGPVYLPVIQ